MEQENNQIICNFCIITEDNKQSFVDYYNLTGHKYGITSASKNIIITQKNKCFNCILRTKMCDKILECMKKGCKKRTNTTTFENGIIVNKGYAYCKDCENCENNGIISESEINFIIV